MALADRRASAGDAEECGFQMGYFRGLTHGAVVGAVLGLLYAPDSGVEMRRRVSRLLGQAETMMAESTGAPGSSTAGRRRAAGGSESRARRP